MMFILIVAMLCFGANPALGQWSRGGSTGGGWGGAPAGRQWGAPAAGRSQAGQPPAGGRQTPARPPQASWSAPRIEAAPARPSTTERLPRPSVTVPGASRNWWIAPGPRWHSPHWQRDRFFRHRHLHGFVLVPGFIGGTTVITEVAPGVIREERRYVPEAKPEAAPIGEPGQLAPYDPTPHEIVERMLALAEIRDNDVVYDLGSGDGRLLIAAARKSRARGVGFEIDRGLVKLARENARREGVEKLVEFRVQDFLGADLSRASVVTLYLSYDGNLAVREQLQRQLKRGARIVSYTFDMGDWPPKIAESYRDASGDTHALYLWEIGQKDVYSQRSEALPRQAAGQGPLIIEVK